MKNKIYTSSPIDLIQNSFDFTNNENDKNILFAICGDEFGIQGDVRDLFDVLDVPIIGCDRKNKLSQTIMMDKYNIKHPKTYYNTLTNRPFSNSINEFDCFCDLKEFVVKPIYGARGIGVKKLTRSEYKNMMYEPRKYVKDVYKNECVELEKNNYDIPATYIEDAFFDKKMLVQECVDVNREFRLLLFPENELIYEREKQEGQFLGNLSHGSKSKKVDIDTYHTLSYTITEIRNMLLEKKYPWLSVDLYIDSSLDVGVFEFQMEFAYEGFEPQDVKREMEHAVQYYIEKFSNKKADN